VRFRVPSTVTLLALVLSSPTPLALVTLRLVVCEAGRSRR